MQAVLKRENNKIKSSQSAVTQHHKKSPQRQHPLHITHTPINIYAQNTSSSTLPSFPTNKIFLTGKLKFRVFRASFTPTQLGLSAVIYLLPLLTGYGNQPLLACYRLWSQCLPLGNRGDGSDVDDMYAQ